MNRKRKQPKFRLTAVLKYLPNLISEMPEFAMLLRLTEARSGARVCDPQRVGRKVPFTYSSSNLSF